jgi:hypothetical protein
LLDALVEILQQGITRNPAEVTDRLERFGFSSGELWRKGAGETIWLIMKTDPNITFLGRPARSYQGVPAELVAWVLGVDVEDFYRFRRELPEAARRTWDFGLSYVVIDDITGWHPESFVDSLRLRKSKKIGITPRSRRRSRMSDETMQHILNTLGKDKNE